VTVLTIFSKIKMQSFFWGFGTAIGELPPYFVSRAGKIINLLTRLINNNNNDDDDDDDDDKQNVKFNKL